MKTTEIKVILPASLIPQGEIVTKLTGTYKYNIVDRIIIHNDVKNENQPVIAEKGTLFMTNNSGDISCIADTKELVWHTDIRELRKWIGEETEKQEYDD